MGLIHYILVAARPRQWIKNLGLFIPIFLDGKIFYPDRFHNVLMGSVTFCFLSSSNYIVNDILDAASDRLHPYKRHRPLATDALSLHHALGAALLLGFIGLFLSYLEGQAFFVIAVSFVVLHHLSYFFFRKIQAIDVLMLASGYVLRVMAGEEAAGVTMSVWLFLTVLSGSLLLAIGKRRSEMAFVQSIGNAMKKVKEEYLLYSEKVLDSYVAVFASATFLSYTYYTFLSTTNVGGWLFRGYTDYLWSVIQRKWMMITVPFVLYGIMRYLQLVYAGKGPLSKLVTTDRPLLFTMTLWVVSVLFVVYGIGG